MASWVISLLGAPRVEREGVLIHFRRHKGLALFAYLAVTIDPAPGCPALLFWPEADQSSALANLRREIYRLEDDLGDEVIAADRSQVS